MKVKYNELSSINPSTQDLILRGKNIVIEGEGGTLPLTGANPLGVGFAPLNAYYVHGGGNVSSNAFEYEYFPAQIAVQLGSDFSMRGNFQNPINAKIIRGEFTYRRM